MQLWNNFSLLQKLRLVWARLTLSKTTAAYFSLALANTLILAACQITALYINMSAISTLEAVHSAGHADQSITFIAANGSVVVCRQDPHTGVASACAVAWAPHPHPSAGAAASPLSSSAGVVKNVSPNTATTTATTSLSFTLVSSFPTPTLTPQSPGGTLSASTSFPRSTLAGNTPKPAAFTDDDDDNDNDHKDDDNDKHGNNDDEHHTDADFVVVTVTVPAPSKPTASASASQQSSHHRRKRGLVVQPSVSVSLQGQNVTGVQIFGLAGTNASSGVFVNSQCVEVLSWPIQMLKNTKREDIVFVAFQFWAFSMSIVALLNESTPHVIASLTTHMLATGWAAFQLASTASFKQEFRRITVDGACDGVNLLPSFWTNRGDAEISVLAVNCATLAISLVLSWKLLRAFGWQTFKRIGASLQISRIYKIVLILSITLQLSIFFIVVSMALWIDQLYSGPAGLSTAHAKAFEAVYWVVLLALIPWIAMGWFASRRERRRMMHAFLVLSALLIAAWAFMFVSKAFRVTFTTWTFFALMSVCAVVLTLLTLIFGVLCRVNFGRGLKQYLQVEDEKMDACSSPEPPVEYERAEKIAYPEPIVPTFSLHFGEWIDSQGGAPQRTPSQLRPPGVGAGASTGRNADGETPRLAAVLSPVMEEEGSGSRLATPRPTSIQRNISVGSVGTVDSMASWESGDENAFITVAQPPRVAVAAPARTHRLSRSLTATTARTTTTTASSGARSHAHSESQSSQFSQSSSRGLLDRAHSRNASEASSEAAADVGRSQTFSSVRSKRWIIE
ncbi:hypothetical protein BOTBODRAFT_26445 [Botryobasidium botryosum FD-172 SS1]|uniref:Uncharacterized protein n=1 Tax=Botryobasidium botryosum (strain FD-172 SS1) TaxID=930990 RepID=A0A067N0G8_BOTB1|nr:hypothetical protein BOTBODRAFT_26445 [Botryobasidium botryosum FD-172 SS1]